MLRLIKIYSSLFPEKSTLMCCSAPSEIINSNSADLCKYIINKQGTICCIYYFGLYPKDYFKTFIGFIKSFMSKHVPD